MRVQICHIIGAFLLPLAVGATNSSSVEGLLGSNNVDLGAWSAAYAQAQAFIAGLSNEDKLSLITGSDVKSANWKSLVFLDGTQGPQAYEYVTGWSETSALAHSWDKTMMWNQFKGIAAEFYNKGVQVTNAPTSQPLGRTPWGGRLVETMGQDSYLNGIMFGLGVKAFTETGIIPGGKHFLLNEQETNRQSSTGDIAPYTSNVDDKTLHETYLAPFYDGVKNGLGAVMCAMTQVNGTLSCENSDLLMHYLKTEIGFPGLVYPDVSGQSTAFGSANGGLDYGSSRIWSNSSITTGLSNGTLSQARLDDMAMRNVIGYYYVNLNNGSQPSYVSSSAYRDVRANHGTIVRENGAASLVLLKNTNNALPLSKPLSMAIFGPHAGPVMAGPNYAFTVNNTEMTYQGHLAGGSGSGQTSFPYLITPQHALTTQAKQDGTMIRWILNNTYTSTISGGFGAFIKGQDTVDLGGNGTAPSGGNNGTTGSGDSSVFPGLSGGTALTQSISSYASDAEVCLVFLNAFSGEGADRTELRNTEQDSLVTSVAAECNNTIVIINTVGARLVDTWIENKNVTAVVYGGLLGQESGDSIVDILYGNVNPSGRLSHTIAKNESDYNVEICTTHVCNFTEGNYIDYKYFDAFNITPRFEFGFGLSYTNFTYSNLEVEIINPTALASTYPTGILSVGGKEDLWTDVVSVNVTISNSGSVAGNEIAELYLEFPAEADEPVRQLRGFEKTSLLAAGDSETLGFKLRRRDLSVWDTTAQDWLVVRGTYVVNVGASSRDLRVLGNVVVV
ncbi:d46f09c4-f297-40a4-8a25-6a02da090eaf [Sclerotinia trifoliorum]|uniref:beta-glucosidase n=1 Tax=Sclerotinia trifoliorum TaxID=28548 RepID=A0A8H2VWQ0_9HELO|nr:d46f09c4-f297-40a4-8a25-6a02da090eaf [Sclerotinia trifoliorum]